jgi:hypothetical protein
VLYGLAGMGGPVFLLGLWNLDFRATIGGLLLWGAAFGIWYLQRKYPNRIIITREEIRYDDRLVQRRSFVIPFSEIESVNLRDRESELTHSRTLKLSGKELLLSTDGRTRHGCRTERRRARMASLLPDCGHRQGLRNRTEHYVNERIGENNPPAPDEASSRPDLPRPGPAYTFEFKKTERYRCNCRCPKGKRTTKTTFRNCCLR